MVIVWPTSMTLGFTICRPPGVGMHWHGHSAGMQQRTVYADVAAEIPPSCALGLSRSWRPTSTGGRSCSTAARDTATACA